MQKCGATYALVAHCEWCIRCTKQIQFKFTNQIPANKKKITYKTKNHRYYISRPWALVTSNFKNKTDHV